MGIMPVLVIAAGGFFLMKGSMDYIDILTFSLYVTTFITPIRKLSAFVEQFLNGMAGFRHRTRSMANCFANSAGTDAKLLPGYGGIMGVTAEAGLVSYRVSEPRYAAPEGAALRLDAYSCEDVLFKVTFYVDANEERGYSAEVPLEGGGKWKSLFFEPSDFKTETGQHLENFKNVVSVVFVGSGEVLINNVLWI